MDTSSLVPSIVLAGSLLGLTYLILRESQLGSGMVVSRVSAFVALTALLSTFTSGTTLIWSIGILTWPLLWGFAALLLVIVTTIRFMAQHLASRHPSLVALIVAPTRRIPRPASDPRSHISKASDSNGQGIYEPANSAANTLREAESVITPEGQASLDERERSMITSILRLDEFSARDIMLPRMDIVVVDVSDNLSDVANHMLESGHSRLPVFRETIDNIVGIVHARDLLPLLNSVDTWPSLETLLRPPFFVPEAKRLDELLSEFQRLRVHMALVVDEHGGIEGLVTLEDLLEEIVGEIEDEFSTTTEPQVTSTDHNQFIVDPRISLNNLEELIPFKFEEVDVNTIGGLVYSQLGKMPQAGDKITHGNLQIEVLSTVGRRISKLLLKPEYLTK